MYENNPKTEKSIESHMINKTRTRGLCVERIKVTQAIFYFQLWRRSTTMQSSKQFIIIKWWIYIVTTGQKRVYMVTTAVLTTLLSCLDCRKTRHFCPFHYSTPLSTSYNNGKALSVRSKLMTSTLSTFTPTSDKKVASGPL